MTQLLLRGVRAARAGQKQRAREALEKVLRADRSNEIAWIYLASVVDTNKERRVCLQQVLKINPGNARAQDALNSIVGVLGDTQDIDYDRILLMAKDREFVKTSGILDDIREERRVKLSNSQVIQLALSAIVLLFTFYVTTFGNPLAPPPTPPPTSIPFPENYIAFAEVTDEAGEIIEVPINLTPTLAAPTADVPLSVAGVEVTRQGPTPIPTITPLPTGTPTNTPTATATLPPITDYAMVFQAQRGSAQPGLYLAESLGGLNAALVQDDIIDIDFAPNQQRVAFVRQVPNDDGTTSRQIFLAQVLNFNNSIAQITRQQNVDSYDPALTPDGRTIVYVSDRDGDPELYLYNIESGATRQLTNNAAVDINPDISEDGTQVVFASDRLSPGLFDIYSLDVNTTQSRALINTSGSSTQPSISPDGQQIAYVNRLGSEGAIFITDAEGQGRRRITTTGGSDNTAPTWTPDGVYLFFLSDRENPSEYQIFFTQPDAARRLELIALPGLDVQEVRLFRP